MALHKLSGSTQANFEGRPKMGKNGAKICFGNHKE
jgi:hypothetical protein